MKLAGSSERRVFNLHLNIHRLGCVLERGGSRSPAVDASVPRKHTSVTRRFEHEPRVSDAISISGKGLTPPPLQGKGKNRKSLEKFETKAENRERTKMRCYLKFGWNESTCEMHREWGTCPLFEDATSS